MQLDMLTLLSLEAPAKPFRSQESDLDWMTLVVTWPSSVAALFTTNAPVGSFSRMSPACSRLMADGTLARSSQPLQDTSQDLFLRRPKEDGETAVLLSRPDQTVMASPTEFLTLSTLEFPSAAVASSLLDILETGDVPQRYFLSSTACKGILRRADKRGKELPLPLRAALQEAADSGRTLIATAA